MDARSDDDAADAAAAAGRTDAAGNPASSLIITRTYGLHGHLVIEDFLSPAEEAALLAAVEGPDSPPWRPMSFNGKSMAKEVRSHARRRCLLDSRMSFPFCSQWGADMDL